MCLGTATGPKLKFAYRSAIVKCAEEKELLSIRVFSRTLNEDRQFPSTYEDYLLQNIPEALPSHAIGNAGRLSSKSIPSNAI